MSSKQIEIVTPETMNSSNSSSAARASNNNHNNNNPPPADRSKDVVEEPEESENAALNAVRIVGSSALLVWSILVVVSAMFGEKTSAVDYDLPPIVAFLLWLFMLVWLATMEGGQGCLVGLQPTNKALYASSHPITYKNTIIAHKGDNMERFVVGRQFLVVLVIFLINLCGSALADVSVLGMGSTLTAIFLDNGLAMILSTIILGQITAQINAATCMLDFINNSFMLFTTKISLAIEFSGLLHSVYLVQYVFAAITGVPVESKEAPLTGGGLAFFWGRVLLSLSILGFSFAVTMSSLFDEQTKMWDSIPPAPAVIIFAVLLCFVGMMEGMQIALFAVVKLDGKEYRDSHKLAAANCDLIFTGKNLEKFLIGRQICVTCCMFVAARVVSINKDSLADDETILGVSDGLQSFINTGLLGAIITTIVGSLMWRIIASSFPLAFLSNPLIFVTIHLCLFLEMTGLCSAAWPLASVHKGIAGFQEDKVYIDEEAEQDDEEAAHTVNDLQRVLAQGSEDESVI